MACREQIASDNFEGMTRYTFAPSESLGDPIMKPTSKHLTCRHDWQCEKWGWVQLIQSVNWNWNFIWRWWHWSIFECWLKERDFASVWNALKWATSINEKWSSWGAVLYVLQIMCQANKRQKFGQMALLRMHHQLELKKHEFWISISNNQEGTNYVHITVIYFYIY